MTKREKYAAAIRCCREQACDQCPMQTETCDEFMVRMNSLPEELVDRILAELENRIVVLRPGECMKEKWMKSIADNQLAIGGVDPLTDYEQGQWDGLQMAYDIMAENE